MNIKIICLLPTLFILLSANSCDNITEIEKEVVEISKPLPNPINIRLTRAENALISSDQAFAFEFFAKVFAAEKLDQDVNFMVSPFSLSMALAMIWNGSANDTKLAIQKTLGMNRMSDNEVNSYFRKLKESFETTDPSTRLAIANSIWTNKNIPILLEFVSLNQIYYNATVEAVDFSYPSSTLKINQWASDKTNGLINNVIDEIDPQALMYLLNALYFKGIWTSPFDIENTSRVKFIPERGSSRKVMMMNQNAHFNYTSDRMMQMIELPYGNEAFNMIVLLPKQGRMVSDISRALLNKDLWNTMKNQMKEADVDLYLPRFKTEYSKKLNNVLKDMGMGVAFDPNKADFSRMSNKASFISFVEQFTYIATDEIGTEAAVTTGGMMTTSMPSTPEKVLFKVDKSFMYVIEENSTGSILFMGVVNKTW